MLPYTVFAQNANYEDSTTRVLFSDDFENEDMGKIPSKWKRDSGSTKKIYRVTDDPLFDGNKVFEVTSTGKSWQDGVGIKTQYQTNTRKDIIVKYITREVTEEMNFMDHAISEIINGEDLVQVITDIYEYLEIRSELEKYPSWIKNIIAFIDCDTELGMDGLDLKSYADAVKVFDEIGLIEEAEVLRGCDNDIRRECREML